MPGKPYDKKLEEIGKKLIAKYTFNSKEIPSDAEIWRLRISRWKNRMLTGSIAVDFYDFTKSSYAKQTVAEIFENDKRNKNVLEHGEEDKILGWIVTSY